MTDELTVLHVLNIKIGYFRDTVHNQSPNMGTKNTKFNTTMKTCTNKPKDSITQYTFFKLKPGIRYHHFVQHPASKQTYSRASMATHVPLSTTTQESIM